MAPVGEHGKVRPFAERLHFIPRLIKHPQAALVRLLRRTLERSPYWVLLTTTGRKTGLPREVLLPCDRFDSKILVISTYGLRSNWIRNIERHPRVQVTHDGVAIDGRAEILFALDAKQTLVSAHPFFVPFPTRLSNLLHRTLLRPLWVPFLRWWVRSRPVVLIHLEA